MLGYRLLIARAHRHLQRARDTRYALRHFHALTDGTKELKLHAGRRRAFLTEEIEPAIERLRHAGFAGAAPIISWRKVGVSPVLWSRGDAPFWVLGSTLRSETLSGYVLASFYDGASMDAHWGWPSVAQGQLALRKVEELQLSLVVSTTTPSCQLWSPSPLAWGTFDWEGSASRTGARARVVSNLGLLISRCGGEIVFWWVATGAASRRSEGADRTLLSPGRNDLFEVGTASQMQTVSGCRATFPVFSDFYLFHRLLGLKEPGLDTRAW